LKPAELWGDKGSGSPSSSRSRCRAGPGTRRRKFSCGYLIRWSRCPFEAALACLTAAIFSNSRASAKRRGPAQAWANNVTPKGIRSDIRRASAVQACRELIKDFLPIGTAPASISRCTTVALRSGLYLNAGQAAVVGNPARSILSLMVKVRPLSGSSHESLSTRFSLCDHVFKRQKRDPDSVFAAFSDTLEAIEDLFSQLFHLAV
jgi:hypothetical protein